MARKNLVMLSLLSAFAIFSIAAPKPAQAQSPSIVEFDAPNASTLPGYGTFAYDNNSEGMITGYYVDVNIVPHGFLRTLDGHILSFDAPGASQAHGADQGTVAYSINDLGVITGTGQDANNVFHGFVRFPNGSFQTFDAPGAGTGAYQGTVPEDVNLFGVTAGFFIDANNISHGFVRSIDGHVTTFDAPGAVDAGIGTFVCEETCLNLEGEITGWFYDANETVHGFLREPNGHITVFDAPYAATGNFLGTIGASINPAGTVTGYSLDANNVAHSYLRAYDGTFTTFEVASASMAPNEGTAAFSVNLYGSVAGEYNDSNSAMHGFSRSSTGNIVTFDALYAGASAGQGTRPSTNNMGGEIVGWYVDGNNVSHGFLRTP